MIALHYLFSAVGKPFSSALEEIFVRNCVTKRRSLPAAPDISKNIEKIPYIEYPFGLDPNATGKSLRFKGTKVTLYSLLVSPNYPVTAVVESTEDDGSTVFLSWVDLMGLKTTRHRLRPDERIVVIGIKDNGVIKRAEQSMIDVNLTAPAIIRKHFSNEERVKREKKELGSNSIKTLARRLRHHNITFMPENIDSITDKISVIYGQYYIEDSDQFEFGSVKRGVFFRAPHNEKGIALLISKINHTDREFNVEALVKNGRDLEQTSYEELDDDDEDDDSM